MIMARGVIELAVTPKTVRADKLTWSGKAWSNVFSRSWPVFPEEAAPAAPETEVSADGQEPEQETKSAEELLAEAFRESARDVKSREVNLALPLSRFLVKIFTLPPEAAGDVGAAAATEIVALYPFPEENPAIGWEIAGETETGITVIAAALPEETVSDIGAALLDSGLRVLKTDALVFGWIRVLWNRIFPDGCEGLRAAVFDLDDAGLDIVVFRNGTPVVARGLGEDLNQADIQRGALLAFVEANSSEPSQESVGDIAVVLREGADAGVFIKALGGLAPLREVRVASGEDCAAGLAERAGEARSLDATPQVWIQDRFDFRFKRAVTAACIGAFALWVAAMGVMFGGSAVYSSDISAMQKRSRRYDPEFSAVSNLSARVKLVQKYSDYERSALDMLWAVSGNLPDGITLSGFNYECEKDVRMPGFAENDASVREFCERMSALSSADEENIFALDDGRPGVAMPGTSDAKGKRKFSMTAKFKREEEPK